MSNTPARAVTALENTLLVADQTGIKLFSVDKESGAIQQTDALQAGPVSEFLTDPATNAVIAVTRAEKLIVHLEKGKLKTLPAGQLLSSQEFEAAPPGVLEAGGKFMYAVDSSRAELMAFRVEDRKPVPLSPASYPLPGGSASITLVKP